SACARSPASSGAASVNRPFMKTARRSRAQSGYRAFIVNRVSGILLALFLPLHFWLLAQSLTGAAALDDALRWVDRPAFKLAEWGLVVLLAAHLTGGLRLLALEFLPWRLVYDWQRTLLEVAGGSIVVRR